MNGLRITALDHIVLNVGDVERSLAFYTGVLGLEGERLAEFRRGEVGFPSVRINADTLIDLSPTQAAVTAGTMGNLNHFCLVAEDADLSSLVDSLRDADVPIVTEPVSRWGARGRATSIYVLDPDGNEVEIRCY